MSVRMGEDGEANASPSALPSHAPWYTVSTKSIVSVEHPFIVKNIEKGVESLGGPGRLQELTQDTDDPSARLYLHPGDRMSKPLRSAQVNTNNVLLKITVPKRVRVKRRRPHVEFCENYNSNGLPQPRQDRSRQRPTSRDTPLLLHRLRDNPQKYEVAIVGQIGHTHRFRGMPDFVLSTENMSFMKKMQEHVLSFDYKKMKDFKFDMSKGVKPNTEIIPPPSMTHVKHPYNYSYRQNPSVKQIVDQFGNVTTTNLHMSKKTLGQPIPFDFPEVPSAPPEELPPVESLEPSLQRLIASTRHMMEERPIFTRRALSNMVPGTDWVTVGSNAGKRIYPYCGYAFASGPWRDALIRFGLDPRKDPKCKIYQTMMFMLENEPKDSRSKWNRSKLDPVKTDQELRKESHIFDGETVSKDGKTWQVCDITDPLLENLLATNNLREECHTESDGWYHNGTWAKVKIIMKVKMQAILAGMPQDEAAYAKVVRDMPDVIRPQDKIHAKLGEGATRYEIHLASQIRTASFSYRASVAEKSLSADEGSNSENMGEEKGDPTRSQPGSESEVIDPRLKDLTVANKASGGETAQV